MPGRLRQLNNLKVITCFYHRISFSSGLRCGTMQHWPIFRYSDNIIEMVSWSFQTMCFGANVPHAHIKCFGLVWTSKPHCHGKGRLHRPAIRTAGPWQHAVALISLSFHPTSEFFFFFWAIVSQSRVGFNFVGDSAAQGQPGTRCTLMKTHTEQGGLGSLLALA